MNNLKSVLSFNNQEVQNIPAEVVEYIKQIEEYKIADTVELLKEESSSFKVAVDTLKARRKEYYDQVETEKKSIISLENKIEGKRKTIALKVEELEAEEVEARRKKAEEYFDSKRGDIFDFIKFEDVEHSSFTNKDSLTSKGEVVKKTKDIIDEAIAGYKTDESIINGDEVILEVYKENGYNVTKAIATVNKMRELEAKANEKKEEEPIAGYQTVTKPVRTNGQTLQKVSIEIWHDPSKIDNMVKYMTQILEEKEIVYNVRKEEHGE